MLRQQVLETIKKYKLINYGDGIVVGISGGYDSVCLLHILYSFSEELNLKLYPVHINHMLRGSEAQRDESFVRTFCSSLGLNLHAEEINVAKMAEDDKISLEEAGRNARYEIFNKVAALKAATSIAVAHSRNDQAETILMRICRGTGLEGLRGMEYKRDNIIRPLLDIDRYQIESYVNENNLEAVTDSSNLHTDFFRNRIRLNVMPQINSAANIDISQNLLRLSKIVVADDDYLRYNAEISYQKCLKSRTAACVELELSHLKEMHQAIKGRVLRLAISDILGSLNGIGYTHIEKIILLIENGQTGSRIEIPHEICASKSYGLLLIKKHQTEQKLIFEKEIEVPGSTLVDSIGAEITTRIIDIASYDRKSINKNKAEFTIFVDFEEIKTEQN
jgi:tRNA(Ile)-lysidine synthase